MPQPKSLSAASKRNTRNRSTSAGNVGDEAFIFYCTTSGEIQHNGAELAPNCLDTI
jgi:hypothetical protein